MKTLQEGKKLEDYLHENESGIPLGMSIEN